jgi:hypothetical protein
MSTDLGKTFNGVALVASTFGNPFNNILDFWVKSDGSVIYALTNDNGAGDVDLWRYASATWQRILILDAATYGTVEIVRSAQSNTNAIYVGKPTNNNRIIKSVDGGTSWILRSCTQAIADLAVQSATVAYVAGATAVVKTSNGCTSWTTVGVLTAGAGYSINLLADNEFVVGGTTGYVGYYDGTAWTAITVRVANGPAVVTASGTATGDVIFSGTAAANGLGFWTIGTSTALTGWTADAGAPAVTGLSFANGILYAFDDAANNLYRYYMPSIGLTLWKDTQATAGTFNGANTINSLQMVAGSNILWARDASTNPDTLQSYTEYLLAATPAGTYPVNNVIIPVNSLNGMTSPFLFQWTAPAVTAPLAGWTYNVFVYYDAAGLIMIGGPYAAGGVTNLPAPAGLIALLNPGDTYYWQVQIVTPIHSGMSPMQSFTVQQLQAIVPVIHTPVNGVVLDTLSPGFSWAPISGVTSYQFQLSKEPSFVVLVYSDNTTTAGEALPVALKLVAGTQYFWRVRAAAPAVGDWSEVGNFSVTVPVIASPTPTITPTITILPTPTITVTLPQPTVIIPTSTAVVEKISPAYIWAIIIIGAVLVIAVIVLIVRTRRTV